MASKKPTGIYLIIAIFALMGAWSIVSGILLMTSSAVLSIVNTYLAGIGIFAGILLIFVGIFQILTAYGINEKERWSKPATVVMVVIGLFQVPMGTLLSLIVIVALLFVKDVKEYW